MGFGLGFERGACTEGTRESAAAVEAAAEAAAAAVKVARAGRAAATSKESPPFCVTQLFL
jgi:hypothetical protein